MTKGDNIIVPRWFLENVEDTLRIQNNINLDKETGETCQDRNVRQSLNGIRKLLKGEELTGRKRLEKLQPSLPSNIDEAANMYGLKSAHGENNYCAWWHRDRFKTGAEWMAGQGDTVEGVFKAGDPGYPDVRMGEQYSIEHILCKPGGIEPGDEVIVQIRKKQ